MVREKTSLPEADLVEWHNLCLQIQFSTERLEYTYQRVADAKTQILVDKGTKPLQAVLAMLSLLKMNTWSEYKKKLLIFKLTQ